MKIYQFLLLVCFVLLSACQEMENGEVYIRVENVSDYDYQDLIVSSGSPQVSFGNIAAHSYSEYRLFEKAYHYGFVQLEIDGLTGMLVPIDYVGETPLKPGKYTYRINATVYPDGISLNLEFITD